VTFLLLERIYDDLTLVELKPLPQVVVLHYKPAQARERTRREYRSFLTAPLPSVAPERAGLYTAGRLPTLCVVAVGSGIASTVALWVVSVE